MKIRGQYHMKADTGFEGSTWKNPACRSSDHKARNTAIIGCGNFAYSNIAYYLAKYNPRFLRAAHDIRKERALSLCRTYKGSYATDDVGELLNDDNIDIVYIASNHASHAEYAVSCLEAGKHVHIEKPHAVTEDQLTRLTEAMVAHPELNVFLGFNRPRSRLFLDLQNMLAQEDGPIMINWFIAGHEIPEDHWYFDEKEGGRVLGNLCHWTDLTLHLVSLDRAFPCTIVSSTPKDAESDFAVSVIFGDRSCASITFSAKGHTFEGVREVLNLHKGSLLANLTDFQYLTMDVVEKKIKKKLFHRDHGHKANIIHSAVGSVSDSVEGEPLVYTYLTARFYLAIRESIDTGNEVTLSESVFDEVPLPAASRD